MKDFLTKDLSLLICYICVTNRCRLVVAGFDTQTGFFSLQHVLVFISNSVDEVVIFGISNMALVDTELRSC